MLSLPIKYIGKYILGKKSKHAPEAAGTKIIGKYNIYRYRFTSGFSTRYATASAKN